MKEPKFVTGERVGLVSESLPEKNGEYTVSRCRFAMTRNVTTGERSERYSYGLDGACIGVGGGGDDTLWHESALRKLPPNTPSTFEDCIFKPEKVNV